MPQEKTFENKIKKFLDSKACWYVKYFANSFTKSGIPDLLVNVHGYFVAIEVKAENGKPSDLQIHTRDKIREAGGICIILYPSQFQDFKEMIEYLGKGVCTTDFYDHVFMDWQYDFDRS